MSCLRSAHSSFWLLLLALCIASLAEKRGEDTYDFVIVGGGLAGSVLADRLSASGRHSVLLLNVAGAPPKAYGGPVMITDEFIIKRNITANQGLRARIEQPGYSPVPHFSTTQTGFSPARMLGGSTLVALSLYLRDHPEVFDSWGEGWSWEELRPYFHRAEGLQGTETALRESDYGQKGPYTIQEFPAYTHPLTREFIKAAQSAGLPWSPDLNTYRGAGVGLTPTTQRADGSKVHAYDAYLRPALGRTNLVVRHGARADRLIIKDNTCRGVAFRNRADNSDHVVYARKEVILSSGYVYSPRLLFLSGIGAKEDLDAVGLSVVKDLPAVGRNLTAARYSPIAWRTSQPTLSQMMGQPISPAGTRVDPAAYGSAVLEATARARSAASARSNPHSKRSDMVLSFMPLFYAPKSAPLQYSLQGEPWPLKTNAYTILATLGETKAQGSVRFTSGSPDVDPLVTHDAMTDPEDLERVKEVVELARKIGGSAQFTQPGQAIENGAGDPDMWTAVYDGRGSCRMGQGPHDSVVDHELRVHGISGLRVVDGSVIPVGSPYLAVPEVLALAERASELIQKNHMDKVLTLAERASELIQEQRMDSVNSEAHTHASDDVSIASLYRALGGTFSIMEAVTYLSGQQPGGLLEVPAAVSSSMASGLVAMWMCVVCMAVIMVLAVRHTKTRDNRDASYAALSA